jgi:hypothetical protein
MSDPKISDFDNGLRILARMIARAYLKDLAQQPIQQKSLRDKKEENDANQRCNRGCKASPLGKDKAGNQERER